MEHDPNEKASHLKTKLDSSMDLAELSKGNDQKNLTQSKSKEKEEKHRSDKSKVTKPKEYFENIRVLIRSRPLNKNELGKVTSVYLDPTVK